MLSPYASHVLPAPRLTKQAMDARFPLTSKPSLLFCFLRPWALALPLGAYYLMGIPATTAAYLDWQPENIQLVFGTILPGLWLLFTLYTLYPVIKSLTKLSELYESRRTFPAVAGLYIRLNRRLFGTDDALERSLAHDLRDMDIQTLKSNIQKMRARLGETQTPL